MKSAKVYDFQTRPSNPYTWVTAEAQYIPPFSMSEACFIFSVLMCFLNQLLTYLVPVCPLFGGNSRPVIYVLDGNLTSPGLVTK